MEIFYFLRPTLSDPGGCAFKGMRLRSLACWD